MEKDTQPKEGKEDTPPTTSSEPTVDVLSKLSTQLHSLQDAFAASMHTLHGSLAGTMSMFQTMNSVLENALCRNIHIDAFPLKSEGDVLRYHVSVQNVGEVSVPQTLFSVESPSMESISMGPISVHNGNGMIVGQHLDDIHEKHATFDPFRDPFVFNAKWRYSYSVELNMSVSDWSGIGGECGVGFDVKVIFPSPGTKKPLEVAKKVCIDELAFILATECNAIPSSSSSYDPVDDDERSREVFVDLDLLRRLTCRLAHEGILFNMLYTWNLFFPLMDASHDGRSSEKEHHSIFLRARDWNEHTQSVRVGIRVERSDGSIDEDMMEKIANRMSKRETRM
eukprot:TRINITY_DN12363_c0_g2_i1.p1 TRINITY_DN12363_c0_g2~~TRINITY_DN12363_c0_g2_i1.p1  ORF type:complete len:358 (+),score=105.14 TRINITY_DN12363_c0_g2_i1:63-1076(+)